MSQTIFPAFRYRDADAAVRWLKDAFGAQEQAVYQGEDGVIHHAQLEIEGGLIMLGQYSEEGWMSGSKPDARGGTVSLYIVVGDPDAHHARAAAAGAEVVRELQDMDYGSREYSVRDPEGNLWSFGTYDPNASGAN